LEVKVLASTLTLWLPAVILAIAGIAFLLYYLSS